ncbi:hypothetical protein NL676_037325 [Syzygium grande]|nr:hypothetical protein NL676_037325 [Syzygium grande]
MFRHTGFISFPGKERPLARGTGLQSSPCRLDGAPNHPTGSDRMQTRARALRQRSVSILEYRGGVKLKTAS